MNIHTVSRSYRLHISALSQNPLIPFLSKTDYDRYLKRPHIGANILITAEAVSKTSSEIFHENAPRYLNYLILKGEAMLASLRE